MTKIQNIGQIAIPVKDLESAIIFYRDTLGLEFLFQAPPGLAFFLCGEVRLMLEESPKEKADQYSSVIYFNVADIQSAFRELSTKDVDIVNEPHMIAKMPTMSCGWCSFMTHQGICWH
jgi:methylmalonyl-CoA/ethylmalonyl-CoA epimerase